MKIAVASDDKVNVSEHRGKVALNDEIASPRIEYGLAMTRIWGIGFISGRKV